MKKSLHSLFAAVAVAAAALAAAVPSGCSVDSTNTSGTVSNNAGTVYDFSALYRPTESAEFLVFPSEEQSGTKLTWMRIIQNGSGLQGYDNAGKNWSGSISSVEDTVAHFQLDGATTAGNSVTIAGTMTYVSQQSTISASWLESTGFSGNFFATGTVSSPATNTPTSSLALSPDSATLALGGSCLFTATGGNGTYTWSHTGTCGTLSSTTGSSIRYTYASEGTDVLTVRSGDASATASITCEGAE
jgi:hypothetical protein